jgi:class 3 adenylate cyclase
MVGVSSPPSLDGWFEAVIDAERRGELLTAVDLAEQGLAEYPEALWLKHRSVLALARAGATEEARARFHRYRLDEVGDPEIAALGARIAKDRALGSDAADRPRLAAGARDLYQELYDRGGDYYPAINAATLSLVAGDPGRARDTAHSVLGILRGSAEVSYYAAATEAEAHLILGDLHAAGDALRRAAARHGGDYGALATTRRQLRLVCDLGGLDPELIGILAGPRVAHFCGHRIADEGSSGGFPAEAEPVVAEQIRGMLADQSIGYAYGALASGADILWAEALLELGAELHVVLPFGSEEFIATSVAPAGAEWVARFHRCLESAQRVSYATDDAFLGDDVLFRYGSDLAMGLALLRAGYLDAEARQLAVWDGAGGPGEAGTATDVETWRRSGYPLTVVAPTDGAAGASHASPHSALAPGDPARSETASGRVVRAMLFADVRGFSRLTDAQSAIFAEHVLGAFADVLDRHAAAVEHRNTWGDALFAVLASALAAAECALDLQEAMNELDLARLRLPDHLALRVSGHVGPVLPVVDPVLGLRAFSGSHVSRTARIEPVTPPGAVYVTEPFAATLELQPDNRLTCDYVGHMPAAKDYGRLRMYRLRRRRQPAT